MNSVLSFLVLVLHPFPFFLASGPRPFFFPPIKCPSERLISLDHPQCGSSSEPRPPLFSPSLSKSTYPVRQEAESRTDLRPPVIKPCFHVLDTPPPPPPPNILVRDFSHNWLPEVLLFTEFGRPLCPLFPLPLLNTSRLSITFRF